MSVMDNIKKRDRAQQARDALITQQQPPVSNVNPAADKPTGQVQEASGSQPPAATKESSSGDSSPPVNAKEKPSGGQNPSDDQANGAAESNNGVSSSPDADGSKESGGDNPPQANSKDETGDGGSDGGGELKNPKEDAEEPKVVPVVPQPSESEKPKEVPGSEEIAQKHTSLNVAYVPKQRKKERIKDTHTSQAYNIQNDILAAIEQVTEGEWGGKYRVVNDALKLYFHTFYPELAKDIKDL